MNALLRGVARGLLSVAAVGVGLLLAEGLARFFHLAPDLHRLHLGQRSSVYQLSPNPVLGYEMRANFHALHPDLDESFPSTNSAGQRDIERSRTKPKGTFRVLMLGDSVVAGVGIADLNETLSRQTERLYAGDPKPVEILNFGVGGYNTRAEVELLRYKGLAYQPDAVVLVFVENDYDDFNNKIWLRWRDRPWGVEWLFAHSTLFRRLALVFNLFQFRQQMDPEYLVRWHGEAMGNNNVMEGLQALQSLSKQHHFKPMIILWPRFSERTIGYVLPHTDHWAKDLSALPIVQMAHALGIPAEPFDADFRSDFQKRKGRSPQDLYTRGDSMHPSVMGAQVAATFIKTSIDKYLR